MGRVFKRDGRWAIDYLDHRGKRIRKVVATDKSVAQALLAAAERTSERRKAGVLTSDPSEAKRPLQQHIDGYIEELERRGRDEMYCYTVRKHLENAAFAQGWAALRACTADSINDYLKDLKDDGRSGKTTNQHLADLSAFLGWCKRQGYIEANPCEHIRKAAVSSERTRRALSVLECKRLLKAAPEDRRLVYLTLLYTGLRRAEATGLRWAHVRLGVANPRLELPADLTKSGRTESVALLPDVAAALEAHRQGARDRDLVFDLIPTMPEFREDLAAAGIEDVDERGRKVVLHSLRHSLATMLAQTNVPPAVAMKILRHRDIRLTLQLYTDTDQLPAAAALAALPNVAPEGSDDAKPLGKTGTSGALYVPKSGHTAARTGTEG
jgi:integrase